MGLVLCIMTANRLATLGIGKIINLTALGTFLIKTITKTQLQPIFLLTTETLASRYNKGGKVYQVNIFGPITKENSKKMLKKGMGYFTFLMDLDLKASLETVKPVGLEHLR